MSKLSGRSAPHTGGRSVAGRSGRREPGARRRASAAAGGVLALAATLTPPAAADWSAPALLSRCPTASSPVVVFPASDPHTLRGEGAVLWTGDPSACRGPGATPGIGIAPIGAGELPDLAQPLGRAAGPPATLGGLLAAAGVGDGRILLAAGVGRAGAGVLEGRAGQAFGRPTAVSAARSPVATATSYVGDVAVAMVNSATGRVELRLQRHGTPGLSRRVVVSTRREPVSAVAVGLDYRGDALVVWAQRGVIYRRVRYATGGLDAIEQIAASPPAPDLQALISDDNRGIAAWTTATTDGGARTTTRVYLATSRSGVHFARPRLLEQFADPPGLGLPAGSVRLVRLASEGVMIAWTGMSLGRYVVRAASVSQTIPRPQAVISDPAGDSILADLATGPHGEAIALWLSAPRRAGGFDPGREQLLAARGVAELPGLAVFSAPEPVAGPGSIVAPRLAVDPATDHALAAWQAGGASPGIVYAVRRPGGSPGGAAGHGPGARTRPGAGPGGDGDGDGDVALAGGAAALVLLAGGAGLARARRARRRPRLGPPDRPRLLG